MTMTEMLLEYLTHLLKIWRYQSKKQPENGLVSCYS